MELRIFRSLWGNEETWPEALAACQSNGLAGIEGPVPAKHSDCEALRRALSDRGLDYIAEICTAGSYVPHRHASMSAHLDGLRTQLTLAHNCGAMFANCIAGCDAWSITQSVEFFGSAMEIAREFQLIASFETHRSRSFFNPWSTAEIVRQLPDLKLTCDFSHWCVVCERLIDTDVEVLSLCFERAHHIHARVGYDQGPQVPHPAASEYVEALAAHEGWWEQIWSRHLHQGAPTTTLTPEFGPDGYLHQAPFTRAPVADLREINSWMTSRQRDHFAKWRENNPHPQASPS